VPRRSQPPSKASRGVPSGSSVRQTAVICTRRHRASLREPQGEKSAESHPSLSHVQSGPSVALTGAALAGCRTGRARPEVMKGGSSRIGTGILRIGSFSLRGATSGAVVPPPGQCGFSHLKNGDWISSLTSGQAFPYNVCVYHPYGQAVGGEDTNKKCGLQAITATAWCRASRTHRAC
jgi:hypothetical protein